jgi:16S rRNA (uracil1498-N3)-methyltransferase
MRYFFIEQPPETGRTVTITGPDKNHIKSVLRLAPGDVIGLLDGNGFEYPAEIISISVRGVEVLVKEKIPASAKESPVQITVAQGFLKEKKMDDLVRYLTELGMSRWVPFMAARSVPRPDKHQLASRTKRWKTISAQSIKQCRRGRTMEIGETLTFKDMLNAAEAYDIKIVFWENRAEIAMPDPGNPGDKIFVIIGPEGGLTQAEVDQATADGFVTAGLGPRILRAETATIAACTLVQHLFGDMGKKPLTSK